MGESSLTPEERQAEAGISIDLRLLLDSPSKCAVIILDPTGKVKAWSEGARAVYGYTEEEIVGPADLCSVPLSRRSRYVRLY